MIRRVRLISISRLGSAIDYDDRSNQWESVNNLTVDIGFRRINRVTMSQQVAKLSGNANKKQFALLIKNSYNVGT